MPEGPEIRRVAGRVSRALKGRALTEVRFAFDHLKPWEAALEGRVVTDVTSRGKALLTFFDDGHALYSHNQLYGRWYTPRSTSPPPSVRRSLRVALVNDKRGAFLYSASDVDVWPASDLGSHPFLSRLGPDVLNEELTREDVLARLDDRRFARRRLEGLLLDQGFLAGLGNYLRSEILFAAGVHPRARPCDLDEGQRFALADAALELPRRSLATGGLTAPDELVSVAKARGVPRRHHRHLVFNRDGLPCPSCKAPVQRIEGAGRRVYLCPVCQPSA